MDLKQWKTKWSLIGNDADITSAIADRVISITVSDAAGMESDSLDIVLSDSSPGIKLPPTGAELVLTVEGVRLGLFVVDEISLSCPPPVLRLKAKAAPFDASHGGKKQIQSQKTRSWEDVTLGELVAAIASEHGLLPSVSDTLADKQVGHSDQVNESDISFLTRIAYRFDATCKPVEGRLVVLPRGAGKSVSGKPLPVTTISPKQVTRWQVKMGKRERSESVVATFRDVKTGEDVEVQVGEGEPIRRLTHIFPDEATARQYATGECQAGERAGSSLSMTLPGDPHLRAEGRISLKGFRDGVAGMWAITRARHTLNGQGYITVLECEGVVADGS